jgi:type IV fimbrial biogenesis protein FimT
LKPFDIQAVNVKNFMEFSLQRMRFVSVNNNLGYATCRAMLGVTGIELMVVLAIIGILAAMAAPSFNSTIERQRVIKPAQALLADLRWARGEAIKRNKKIRVTFFNTETDCGSGIAWCYTIDTDPALSTPDGILPKTVNASDFPQSTLSAAAFAGGVAYTAFDPTRGIDLNNGSATFTVNTQSATVTISTLGRARICDAPGDYPAC